jgi:hypothetical protein
MPIRIYMGDVDAQRFDKRVEQLERRGLIRRTIWLFRKYILRRD